MSTSGDTQVVSANFFRDVQNAQYMTTAPTTAPYAWCGTGPQLLGLKWPTPGTIGRLTIVSYSLTPSGTTDNLVRNECDSVGFATTGVVPSSTSIISYNVQSSLAAQVSGASTSGGWTDATGITNVKFVINETVVNRPSDSFTFTLAATPRVLAGSGSGSGWDIVPLAVLGPGSPLLTSCTSSGASVNVNGPILLDGSGSGQVAGSSTPNVNTSLIYYTGSSFPLPSQIVPSPPMTQIPPYADPLQGLVAPNPATLNPSPSVGQPGVYTTTIHSGNLAPGIYYFSGSGAGITLTGNNTITGTGVMLYFTNGASLNMGGTSSLTVSPMTSGPYADLTVWQSKTDSQTMSLQGTTGTPGVTGVVYAPGAQISLGGTGGFYSSDVLAQSVACNGNGTYNFGYTQVPTTAQTIAFTSTAPANATAGGADYNVTVTSGASGNPVTFTIDSTSTSGACTISGSTVSFVGNGTCVVDANQLGSGQYLAAIEVQQSIHVGP